ncbi:MAG: hypothetical protein IJB74_05715 [Clostridia bacterium]|nr:hypothetical protein [Clostridia bacterium]
MENLLNKNQKQWFISFLLASLTVFSYGLKISLAVVPESVTELEIYSFAPFRFITDIIYSTKAPDWFMVLLCAGMAYLYNERLFCKRNVKSSVAITAVSAVIVFALLLCYSYSNTNSWDLVFAGKTVFAKALIKVAGFTPAVFIVVDFFVNLNLVVTQNESYKGEPFKTVLITAAAFMLCWVPYFILLYPGCVTNDAFDQLAQAIYAPGYCWSKNTVVLLDESVILNNHHPLFYTGVMKLTVMLAKAMNNAYEAAFEILCIFQSLTLAVTFAYMIYVMQKNNVSKRYRLGVFLFCALNPLFPIYGMTVVKDTFFCAMFVAVGVQLYELLTLEKTSIQRYAVFFLTVLIFLFTRNNSVYIMGLIALCVIVLYFRSKIKMIKITAIILVPVILYQVVFIGMICPAFSITQGSPREMLSVPFQQTARYIKEHRDEITPEEEEIITAVFNCNDDIDTLTELYAGSFADNVKNTFNKNATSEELVKYFKMWFSCLMKHPMTYVEAYLNLHYGWFSYEGNNFISYASVGTWFGGEMIKSFEGYMGNSSMRAIVSNGLEFLNKSPLTSLMLEMATYTWLYLLLLFYIIKRKNKSGFIVCGLAFFNYLISFVGPVAYMRYALPMVCLAPFAIFIVFKKKKEIENNG